MHVITPRLEELKQANLYILNNNNEVVPYIVFHETLVKESKPKMTKHRVLKEHKKTFLDWLKNTCRSKLHDDESSMIQVVLMMTKSPKECCQD